MSKEKSKVESGLDAIFASISSNVKEINQVNNKKKLDESADEVSEEKLSAADDVSETKKTAADDVSADGKSVGETVRRLIVRSGQNKRDGVSAADIKSALLEEKNVVAFNYFSLDFRSYIINLENLKPYEILFIYRFIERFGINYMGSYRKIAQTLGCDEKQIRRYFKKIEESGLVELKNRPTGSYVSFVPLCNIYLREKGISSVSGRMFGEFILKFDNETADLLSAHTPSMYVSSFIYKEETNNIQTEKKFEIPYRKAEEFRRIIFWLYWFGIDYKEARVNNIRMLMESLESEPDVDTILMSILYTGEKSANIKIDNKWAYFLRGIGKYGTEGVKLKEFNEVKINIEKLYELANLTESQRENFLIENNNLIRFVRKKTRREINEKPKKIAELKILESQIMSAYNSIDKFMELNKIGVELNAFEKSRLHRNKGPHAGGPY